MKSVVIGLAIFLGACSVQHTSDNFACTTSSECASDRTCSGGFCVPKGSVDAPGRPIDAPNGCPSGCTSCNVSLKTCTIDCSLTSCANQVTCPAGYHCDIQCKGDGACRSGVNCLASASCNVQCPGSNSCRNVQCGSGPCDVNCTGISSCRGVTCGASCACDVTCTGGGSCSNPAPVCTSTACFGPSGGCTSVPLVCHSCM